MSKKQRIILDTDPAMGVFGRDVDDGLAIAMALNSPDLEVAGLTVTHGNVPLDSAMKCANRLLNAMGRDDVVAYKGADSSKSLGNPSEAAEFIIDNLKASPNKVSICAIGPLTNLATAEKLEPGILSKAKQIVVMGGAVRVQGTIPPLFQAEFNFWKDAEAAHVVFNAAPGLTLAPIDMTMKVIADYSFLKELSRSESEASKYIFRHTISWFSVSSLVTLPLAGKPGFFPHDPLAVGILLWPELYTFEDMKLTVLRRGPRAGKVQEVPEGSAVKVALAADEHEFLKRLLDLLAAP